MCIHISYRWSEGLTEVIEIVDDVTVVNDTLNADNDTNRNRSTSDSSSQPLTKRQRINISETSQYSRGDIENIKNKAVIALREVCAITLEVQSLLDIRCKSLLQET